MPQRRRLASRDELLELLAAREPGVDRALALAALTAEGVDVDALIRIVVDEEV